MSSSSSSYAPSSSSSPPPSPSPPSPRFIASESSSRRHSIGTVGTSSSSSSSVSVAPAAAAAAAAGRHLLNLRRHRLPGVAQDRNQLPRHVPLTGFDERVRVPFVPRAAGSPDPMDVILDLVRKVKVHDEVHLLDVEPARGDVRGHEHGDPPALELVDDVIALALLLIAVDHRAHPAHAASDLIAHAFRAAKHDRLERLRGRVPKHFHQSLLLLEPAAYFDHLRDVLVRHERVRVADVDLDRVREDRRRDAHHSLGPGGGEEERLPRRRRPRQNLPNLRLEPHVEHPVRLVQHDVRRAAEVHGAGLEEVVQTARRRDGDLRPRSQLS
mmetsp:Transcript_1893/g.6208  ORF Transcript_1893/g.6208 Transcript_1893/m.6208 type:complete len:327 (-) Transcript_1893:977-1957(-)